MKNAAYRHYKESGIDWLGAVPEHWHVGRLKWSTTGCHNGVWGEEPNDVDDLICVRVADFDRDRFVVVNNPPTIRAIELGRRRNRLLQKNDLLIEKSGGGEKQLVGCVVQFTGSYPAVCSNFVGRLPVSEGHDSRYLAYLHSAIYGARLNYPAIKQTTGIQNLNSGEYLNINVAYPSFEEQQRIANFLDRKTVQIDDLISKKRDLIEKLKEKRSALIARVVTHGLPPEAAKAAGLGPNLEMKYSGVDWLGKVPVRYDVLPLRRLVKYVKTGGTPSGAEDHHFEENGFNWYSPVDFSEKIYLGSANRALSIEGKAEVRVFPARTVMFVGIGATIGKVGLALNACSCNQQINAIECNSKLDPVFAAYYFNILRDFIVRCGKFTTLPIINQDETKNLIFTVPPLMEQSAIAAYLDRETVKIDRLIIRVEEVIYRLLEYRQTLITAAVTGKIDVRKEA